MDDVAFTHGRFAGGLSGIAFVRPGYLSSPRAYYFVVLAIFGAIAIGVQNLRRSKTGLAFGAMRDSEVGLGALGVDVARLKLTAFSISAVLAGMGGALLSASDHLATPFTYFKFQSLLFLTLAVIGGIGSWLGAFAGAVIFQLIPPFIHESFVRDNAVTRFFFGDQLEALLPVLFGLAAIGLARNPHGIVEQIRVFFAPNAKPKATQMPVEPASQPSTTGLVTVGAGSFVHRANCLLVAGKETTSASLLGAQPCPVCEPVDA
jgi:branched-chain amino acid transport system permease protein